MAIDADEDDVDFVQFVPETTKGVVAIAVIVVVVVDEVVENDDDDEEEEEDDGDDDEVDEVNKVLFKSTTFADNNAEEAEAETEADGALLVLDTCLPDVDSNADDGTDSILPNLDDDCIFLVRALNADEVDVVDNEVDNGVFLEAPDDDDDDEEDEDNNDMGDQRNKFIFLNNLLVLLGKDSNDNDDVNDNGDEVIADLLPINLLDDEEAMADLPAVEAELERDDEEDDDI